MDAFDALQSVFWRMNARCLPLGAAIAGSLACDPAAALPLYARQTGQACQACHVSFPELTPYGRYFKLTGYTIGERQTIPLATMAQVSRTATANNSENGAEVNPKNNSVVFTGASLFAGGRITDNFGAFAQWTYNGLYGDPNTGQLSHHSSVDNTDIRYAGKLLTAGAQEPDVVYGITLHNNPTVQDVWNSTPAFGFPFAASPVASTPAAATLIDGGLAQAAAGLGFYSFWKKSIYGELTLYRTADGVLRFLRAGDVTELKGLNPYWRLAYNHEWGASALEIGTFGMQVDLYPDPTNPHGPTDRYLDTAFDAQYQYITDPHTVTAQATYIRENQTLDATFGGGGSSNATDTLRTLRGKLTYYYQRTYGATLAYTDTSGSADAGLWGPAGSASGSPDSTWWTLELNYLLMPNVRLMAQYVDYVKFNGGTRDYDGMGRNAHDNSTLFLNVWAAF